MFNKSILKHYLHTQSQDLNEYIFIYDVNMSSVALALTFENEERDEIG